jgi:8-oxo-dGTP pyrophosphatase MutT (NUDIX family)
MRHELSCGVLLFQRRPRRSFLLLVRNHRLDLPKGHIKRGEDEVACALRELEEETGIRPGQIALVEGFRFETTYSPQGKKGKLEKTVVLFAAELEGPVAVVTPDHDDYAWVPWRPPHHFEDFPTIHKALHAWQHHLDHHVEKKAHKLKKAS